MPSQSPRSHSAVTPLRSSLTENGKSDPILILLVLQFFVILLWLMFLFLDYWNSTWSHGMVPLFSTLSSFSRTSIMGGKRDAAMAGLSWPPSDRTTPNPRPTGSSDSDMVDDIGHESFAPPPPATLPSTIPPLSPHFSHPSPSSTYNHHPDYVHYGPWTSSTTSGWQLPSLAYPRERTVHTIYFKIWDPDSPSRSLYVGEINQQGTVRQLDPEHFFCKLTGNQVQANQMSDYWRSHYGLPLHHGDTPHHPTWASSILPSTSPTTTSTIPTVAKQLATLLFGEQAAERLTAPGAPAVNTLPDINTIDSSVTNGLSQDRLLHLAIALRELSRAA